MPGRAGEILQPLREVHGVADERVLEALLATEQRGRDLAGRQPDAQAERRRVPRASQRRVELVLALVHRHRRLERPIGVVGLRERRTEHGHHRVADVLHHGAALGRGWPRSSRPRCSLSMPASTVGSVRSAMPE